MASLFFLSYTFFPETTITDTQGAEPLCHKPYDVTMSKCENIIPAHYFILRVQNFIFRVIRFSLRVFCEKLICALKN